MPISEQSFEFLRRTLDVKLKEIRVTLKNVIANQATDKLDVKEDSAEELLKMVKSLQASLSPNDHPDWLNALAKPLEEYFNRLAGGDGSAGRRLIDKIIDTYSVIQNYSWNLEKLSDEENDDEAIDFTSFDDEFNNSDIPKLFDKLIGLLDDIIRSETIDSIIVNDSLKKLIATLKCNSKSNFIHSRWSYNYFKVFFKHFVVACGDRVIVVKETITAIKETEKELDLAYVGLENILQKKVEGMVIPFPAPHFQLMDPPARISEKAESVEND